MTNEERDQFVADVVKAAYKAMAPQVLDMARHIDEQAFLLESKVDPLIVARALRCASASLRHGWEDV